MKHIKFLFAMLLATSFFIGCNNNPASSGGSIWTEGTGVTNVNHFYASGGNLLASTYCSFCSQAYIFLSNDEGLTWRLDTTFHVYNHIDSGYISSPLYLPAPMTFIDDGKTLFAGIGYVYKGDIYRSTDDGVTWSDKGITWAENESNKEDVFCFSLFSGDMFAGTDDGVFVSTDHGATWNSANVGIPKPTFYYHAPVSGLAAAGNSIFASTWGLGIFRSTNGGLSWAQVNTTNYQFQGLTTIGSDIFAAAFNDAGKPSTGGVFASSDKGGLGCMWTPTCLTMELVLSVPVAIISSLAQRQGSLRPAISGLLGLRFQMGHLLAGLLQNFGQTVHICSQIPLEAFGGTLYSLYQVSLTRRRTNSCRNRKEDDMLKFI